MARIDRPAPRGYSFGKETWLPGSSSKMDNLDLDMLDAKAKGYGCHYGAYKADHPNTKALREAAAEQKGKPLPHNGKLCKHCGGVFVPQRFKNGTLYCSEECRVAASNERAKARRQLRKQQNEEAIYVQEQ